MHVLIGVFSRHLRGIIAEQPMEAVDRGWRALHCDQYPAQTCAD